MYRDGPSDCVVMLFEPERTDAEEEMLNNLWLKEYWSRKVGVRWVMDRVVVWAGRTRDAWLSERSSKATKKRLRDKFGGDVLIKQLVHWGEIE